MNKLDAELAHRIKEIYKGEWVTQSMHAYWRCIALLPPQVKDEWFTYLRGTLLKDPDYRHIRENSPSPMDTAIKYLYNWLFLNEGKEFKDE